MAAAQARLAAAMLTGRSGKSSGRCRGGWRVRHGEKVGVLSAGREGSRAGLAGTAVASLNTKLQPDRPSCAKRKQCVGDGGAHWSPARHESHGCPLLQHAL